MIATSSASRTQRDKVVLNESTHSSNETSFEALELLPAPQRLKRALEDAERTYRLSSSKKALASAKDLLDIARREESRSAQARAHLYAGIAFRRCGEKKRAKAEYDTCENILAPLFDHGSETERKEAAAIQIDLYLEQAIALFVDGEYIESARKNERAAKLAGAIRQYTLCARAWLNASVSWDRAGDTSEARLCLAQGEKALSELEPSSLHTSFALFSMKLGMDRGPLRNMGELPPSSTASQRTLYLLYRWEYALITGNVSESDRARAELEQHIATTQTELFKEDVRRLSVLMDRLHQGGAMKAHLTEDGSVLESAIRLSSLIIKGAWKNLEITAAAAIRNPHPAIQAWGYRAKAWGQARRGDKAEAKASLKSSLQLACAQGMHELETRVRSELLRLEDSAMLEPTSEISPQERRIAEKWASIVPSQEDCVCLIDETGNRKVSHETALRALDHALLQSQGVGAPALLVDGVRQWIRTSSKMISIEKSVMQKRLIFALIAAYTNSISKEDLVSRVWDELYNPLIHDSVLYRAVSRLRKSLGLAWITFESGMLRLTPGKKRFLAILPNDETLLRQSILDERKIRILTLLKYRGQVTRSQAVKLLQAPERTVARDLSFLVERKLAQRQGSGRGTVYVPII
jgi:tetratricopeptide (TPR) repeat protein